MISRYRKVVTNGTVTRTAYEIEAQVFAKEGGVIYLDASRATRRSPLWIRVVLLEDIKPYVTTSLYKAITEGGYFAFAYKEIFADNTEGINVVISEKPIVTLIRDEQHDGETGVAFSEHNRNAIIYYAPGDYYLASDLNRNDFENSKEDIEFNYAFRKDTRWLDEKNSDLTGINLVEQELRRNHH